MRVGDACAVSGKAEGGSTHEAVANTDLGAEIVLPPPGGLYPPPYGPPVFGPPGYYGPPVIMAGDPNLGGVLPGNPYAARPDPPSW